ncbi:MAG: hypothetical protein ACJ75R_10500 [Solirubrobacterales bacterium]|jgi:hypothetical protein
MADDEFRVEVDLHESLHGKIGERLRSLDLDDEVSERLGDRVIVTRDGERIYVYTQSADAAKEAERVVRQVLAEEGLEDAAVRRRRWNQAQLFWQDADEPLGDQAEPIPDPAAEATTRDLPHPLFVWIEEHEPEFLRDLGA